MSSVYFTDLRANPSLNLLKKFENLIKKAGIDRIDFDRKITALKIHFGEPGNLEYIRPNFAATHVKYLKKQGARPFLTDANTLYSGHRSNAIDHIKSAWENGFNPLVPDIGIAASFDPVALDKACVDLVKAAPSLPNSRIGDKNSNDHHQGQDKFHLAHPNAHWEAGLEHAQEIGLGSRKYELIRI